MSWGVTRVPASQLEVPLGPLTTLGIGGPARRLFDIFSVEQLKAVLEQARSSGWSTLVLGDGSNVFVGDEGFDGAVIRLAGRRLVFQPDGRELIVWAEAGASWDRLVDEAVARNAAGIECLSGIPGRVGAAPIQNIGAYGQELAETAVAVEAVERQTGRVVVFDKPACGFGYRTSRFKRERDQWVVTRVQMKLRLGDKPTLSYADVARRAEESEASTLGAVRSLVRAIRAEKSMLRVPGDENYHSAGSFFTNPIVSAEEAVRIAAVAAARTDKPLPRYPASSSDHPEGDGWVKLSAAWLIEQAGFAKGWGAGRAGLSTRHTLALVNRGGASGAELLAAAIAIRNGVFEAFGVALTPEPVFVGVDWPAPPT